jgi:hypothetical protein
MRRDAQTIVAAHKMDRARRDLYVEGLRDKAFLEWLCQGRIEPGAQIIISDFIDAPEVSKGGNRARVLSLLKKVEDHNLNIRGLVDADHLRLIDGWESLPSNAWVTDYRDLEAYVLDPSNIDTAMRAGCGILSADPDTVYVSAARAARYLAAVRVTSAIDHLDLPVSAGRWLRHIGCDGSGALTVREEPLLRALLQHAAVSLARLDEIKDAIAEHAERLSAVPDQQVIHGKDFSTLFTKQLAALGVRIDSASRILLATFPRETHAHSVLAEIQDYLGGGAACGGAAA